MTVKKEVIFWGCGNIAGEMYRKYKDDIILIYGISNNPKETSFTPEPGKTFQVKRPEYKQKSTEGTIVICSIDYQRIAEQLILLGYTPFVDFIDFEVAEIMWSGKRLALLYGSCHLRGVADCMRGAQSFLNKYIPIYYSNYLPHSAYQEKRFQYFLEYCTVFIYGLDISPERYQKNMAILGSLRSEVKVLGLHSVYFGAYFPQKKRTYNDMNELAVKCEGFDYTPFSYGDSWMNACIVKGMCFEDILEYVETGEIYDRDYIVRYAEGEWRRLRYQEQESDFKIADYIEKNYRNRRLFRNETHMENLILGEYAIQLLHHLKCDEAIAIPEFTLLNCSQHFIYPCVARVLELKWDVWSEKLDLYTYAGWKKISMKEYLQLYYEACSTIYQLKKKNILP